MDASCIRAEVCYILSVGPTVRVDLKLAGGECIEVDMSRESAERLHLRVGEEVYARPRTMRVFTEDYQI